MTCARSVEFGLLETLNLDLTDGFGDPLGCFRLGRLHKDFGRGLRKHDLCQMPIDHFKLGLALESQHKRVLTLAILGNSSVELRELLEAGQLVDHKPDLALSGLGSAEKPHHKQVDPKRVQGSERFALRWTRRNKNPSLAFLGPCAGIPCAVAQIFLGQEPERFCYQAERCEHT